MRAGLRSLLTAAPRGAPALVQDERSWSYDRLRQAAEEWAASGIPAASPAEEHPAPIVLLLPPSAEGIIGLHAVLQSGRPVVPLSPGLTTPELAVALRALPPAVVWTDEERAATVRAAVARVGVETEVVTVGRARPDDPTSGAPVVEEAWRPGVPPDAAAEAGIGPPSPGRAEEREGDRDASDPVAVIWTSGTSGRPHGVLLSARGLRHSAFATRERLGLEPGDRWYGSLSLAHVGGLALVTRGALLGATVVAAGGFDAERLADLVDRGAVTHASLVPTMLRRLLAVRGRTPVPPTLRCLLVGGAACPPTLVARALELGYPVALTYGLTEATSQVATAPPDLVRRKAGTVGPPLDGVEVEIDAGGGVRVRGPTVASGLVGGGQPLADEEGWLDTGDLGEIDADGHLRILGRRSDRIVTGGINVDPAEVEATLSRHPAVRECAVVGVRDAEWGERVAALVVVSAETGSEGADSASAGSAPEETPTGGRVDPGEARRDEALRGWLRDRLTGAKVPKEIRVVPALPRNRNGKVDRARVRASFEETGPA